VRPQCSVEGCDRLNHAKGFCRPHYCRWKRSGNPGRVPLDVRPPKVCKVEGCGRPRDARGFCSKHYARWMRHGSPFTGGTHADPTPRRWPLQPLLAISGRDRHEAAEIFNVGRDVVSIALEEGMRDYTADRWCCRLGYHPASIYGDEWWATAEQAA
jgi:hypothetical protein